MQKKIMYLTLGLIVSLSLSTTAMATDAVPTKTDAAPTKADAVTQEQEMNALLEGFQKAASGIAADDLVGKVNTPEGDLGAALKKIIDAGYILVCYGEGNEIHASTVPGFEGIAPKTSDDKPVRELAAEKFKDAKDGKAMFTYTNQKKEERSVLVFQLGTNLVTIGGPKR